MDIELKHLRIAAGETYPKLPRSRAYALVLICHDETGDYWRRGFAETLATGSCVQVNLWGENSSEWIEALDTANALALMTEERCETLPDIEVSSQSNRMLEDVFEFSAANIQCNEETEIDLQIVLEIGEPMFGYDLQGMAFKAAREYGVQPALAC